MANRKGKVKPVLNIIMCVDIMSCECYDHDVNKEYDAIEENLQEFFPDHTLSFKRNIYPHKLDAESFDMYVFDYGGMLPGSESGVASLFKEFIKQANEHTGAVFLLYSSFSEGWYKDLMAEDAGPDFKKQPNVVFYGWGDTDWSAEAKKWLGIV